MLMYSACTMVKIADLPVRMVRNKLIVDGTINGQKRRIVLDTGATTLMLRRRPTGWAWSDATRGVIGYSASVGETKAESVLIDDFRIGQASRKGWRLLVAGEHDFGDEPRRLLGEDFFDQVDVEFDLAHNVVRLFQPKNCDGVSLAYWTTEEPREVAIDAIYDYRPQILLTRSDQWPTGQGDARFRRRRVHPDHGRRRPARSYAANRPESSQCKVDHGLGPKKVDTGLVRSTTSSSATRSSITRISRLATSTTTETYTTIGSRLAKNVST